MIVVIVAIVVKQKFDDMKVVVDDVDYDNDEDLNLIINMLMVWDWMMTLEIKRIIKKLVATAITQINTESLYKVFII